MNDIEAIVKDAGNFRRCVGKGHPYKPLYVKIKIVWACNLRCGMCNHWRDRVESPLDLDFYKTLVNELAELGCQKIHLTGGEPTLRPNLEEIIAHIRDRGIRPTMTTNATLIDGDRAYSLTQAGLRKVNISIDSPYPDIHDKIRGIPGAWTKATAGFQYLRPWLKSGRMQINTVVHQLNYLSLIDLPDFAVSLGADRINLIPMDEHTPDFQRLTLEQIQDYNQRIAPVIAEKGVKFGLIDNPKKAYIFGETAAEIEQSLTGRYAHSYYDSHLCFAPWTHALIDHIGQVSVCCMLPNSPIIGDLRSSSFTEIWNGEAYQALRNPTYLPLFETCRNCDMFLENNRRLEELVEKPTWGFNSINRAVRSFNLNR
ncbi:MAG: radical SAM protein [Cyanobacteriota bacterium]|nr:radical SAM protein [Cyanobacteriota bacterium]